MSTTKGTRGMYTAVKVTCESEEKPSKWKVETQEEFDIIIQYRYGFIVVEVNEEELYKQRVTTDIMSSKMTTEEMLSYAKEHFPEEMLDLSLLKTNNK